MIYFCYNKWKGRTEIKNNKTNNLPLYQQVYLNIKESIDSGELKEGEKLCSEAEFKKKFDVSRITVRRALSDLQHDGYIIAKKGVGTIVSPRKRERDLASFNSFSSRVQSEGDTPTSVILEAKKVIGSVKVCEKLQLDSGSEVFLLKRLRLVNGKIIALHDSFVALKRGVEIKPNDFKENTSLYEFIEKEGVELGSADEIIQVKMPSKEISSNLYLESNEPIMYKERITYTIGGIPIEYSENYYGGEQYKYHIHITKAGSENEEI